MTATPRPRRLAGHRSSALSSAGRPRKVADSRRVAIRSTPGPADSADTAGDPATRGPVQPPREARGGRPAPEPGRSAADPAGSDARGHERRSWLRITRLTGVLLVVAAVLAVGVGLLGWNVMRMDARADARKAAQVVAAESMETILSYDHARYDKGVAAAKTLMTGDFATKYARTIREVRPTVMSTRSVVRAKVVASSVVSAEPDRVKTLLFVNQTTTGKQVQQPRVDLNRVVVTLVRGEDGAWLVSDVEAL